MQKIVFFQKVNFRCTLLIWQHRSIYLTAVLILVFAYRICAQAQSKAPRPLPEQCTDSLPNRDVLPIPPLYEHANAVVPCYENSRPHGEIVAMHTSEDTASVAYFIEGVQHGPYVSYHENGTLNIKAFYVLGKLEGRYERFYKNGTLAAEGRYQDGTPHGQWQYYYQNGKLASKGKLVENKFEGSWYFYYPNGQLKQIEVWRNFLLFDVGTFYTPNGGTRKTGTFTRGNGELWVYYEEGEIAQKTTYYNGKKQGRALRFSQEGHKLEEVFYQADTLHGPFFRYYANGILAEKGVYHKGQQSGEYARFTTKGTLVEKGFFRSNKKEGIWYTYSPKGELLAQHLYQDGKLLGTAQIYNEEGQLEEEGSYETGKKEGVWTTFYPSGKKHTEQMFRHGKRDGMYQEFAESGERLVEGAYVKGTREGTWRYYHPNALEMFVPIPYVWVLSSDKQSTNTPIVVAEYQHGQLNGEVLFRISKENLLQTEQWKDGQLLAASPMQFPAEKPLKDSRYKAGDMQRKWFDARGRLRLNGSYQQGIPEGTWQYFDRKERLILEGTINNTQRVGIWKLYTKRGKVAGTIDFAPSTPKIKWIRRRSERQYKRKNAALMQYLF